MSETAEAYGGPLDGKRLTRSRYPDVAVYRERATGNVVVWGDGEKPRYEEHEYLGEYLQADGSRCYIDLEVTRLFWRPRLL